MEIFDVKKLQLVPLPDDAPIEVKNYFNSLKYEIPESYGTFRDDNFKHLGTVGSQYEVLQNSEMYGITRKAAELCQLNDESIRFVSLNGGRKIAFQVELPDWAIGGNDQVKRFLTAVTSHDGSTGTGLGNTGIRVYCNNTWLMAYRSMTRFKHTAGGNSSVRNLADEMLEGIEQEAVLQEAFEELHRKPFRKIDIDPFVLSLFNYTANDLEKSGRKAAKHERFVQGITDNLIELGENAWAAFNGVTYVTNHVIKRDDQLNYLMFADGSKINEQAFNLLTV